MSAVQERTAPVAEQRYPIIRERSEIQRHWSPERTIEHISTLPLWTGAVQIEQKFGGMQNRTFFVSAPNGENFAVRVGFDQYRTRQTSVVQCTMAAHRLGLGPELVYAEPNLTVTRLLEGRQLELEQMKDREVVRSIIASFKVLHEGSHAIAETISYWWPFDTVRRYLNTLEAGKEATGYQPSLWVSEVPRFRQVVDRLERAIQPYFPKFTHNDAAFVNMFFGTDGTIKFIDWDGGAYGHPLWDIAEMLMWGEADEDTIRFALNEYYGRSPEELMKQRIREVRAFQIMAALRLTTEVMETYLDPYFFLTPDEMAKSMQINLPGERAELAGLIDLLQPRFEQLWQEYQHLF